jgi:hypothetical protein
MAATAEGTNRTAGARLVPSLLLGAVVAISLGVYGRVHEPAQRPVFDLGFSSMLPMKAWLATGALALALVQLLTALRMWRRLPGAGPAPGWVRGLHRWSGATAFVLTLPVAFHCLWSLGYATPSARVAAHSFLGCFFYGAYAAKMLCLRQRGLPGWTLPVLGGAVLATVGLLWTTAALWFFTRSGLPLV